MDAPLRTTVRTRGPVSLGLIAGLLRHGSPDLTLRRADGGFARATRTADGPATVHYARCDDGFAVTAWGPGARRCIESAPAVLGGCDQTEGWTPDAHPLVAELHRRNPSVRFPATGAVVEAALPTVLEQKVQSVEAHESWRRLLRVFGEPAPGPFALLLPPDPARVGSAPYEVFHPFNLERKRTDIVRRLAARACRAEEAAAMPRDAARARLEAFPGVGPWTSAKVAQVAWADADAVAVGDFHLAKIVVHAFTGRRGGTDDEMLELLEPFRPHRGRAAMLLKMSGLGPPRRGPRLARRDFRRA